MGALVRPASATVAFRLYERPLHPELFAAVAVRAVARAGYRLTVRLTPAGHALAFANGTVHLEELMCEADTDLPTAGRRLAHTFSENRRARCAVGGVRYQVETQAERLDAEAFAHLHAELLADGARKGLVFHCAAGNRIGLSPLGCVIAEELPRAVSAVAFHTFPDELTVLKTQSLIEWD
jgi:hypothetical protein